MNGAAPPGVNGCPAEGFVQLRRLHLRKICLLLLRCQHHRLRLRRMPRTMLCSQLIDHVVLPAHRESVVTQE